MAIIVEATKKILQISYDDDTNVNNQNWLSLYVYFIKDWSHIPSLVSFEKVIEGVDLRNLNRIITLT